MGRHGKHRIRNHPTVIKSEISRDFSEQLSITEKIVSPKSKISPSFFGGKFLYLWNAHRGDSLDWVWQMVPH